MRYLKSLITPFPSFYDVAVGGMLFIFTIQGNDNRALFLSFYSIFLFILTLGMTPKREYRSTPLCLLVVWSFLGLFIHNYCLIPNTVVYSWKLFYCLTEGFLYILCGVMFLFSVARYTTNPRFIYFFLPIAVLPILPGLYHVGSSTVIVAFGISTIIYLIASRKYVATLVSLLVASTLVVNRFEWLAFKFRCRPYGWGQMFKNMFYHPRLYSGTEVVDPGIEFSPFIAKWIDAHIPSIKPFLASLFGTGFGQYLNNEYVWVTRDVYGWVHKQNDYMNLACCLGPIVLVFIALFIAQSVKTIGIRPILILFLTVLITGMAQMTMFDPGKATIGLMVIALTLTDGLRRRA